MPSAHLVEPPAFLCCWTVLLCADIKTARSGLVCPVCGRLLLAQTCMLVNSQFHSYSASASRSSIRYCSTCAWQVSRSLNLMMVHHHDPDAMVGLLDVLPY
jgi:hypothetical protein